MLTKQALLFNFSGGLDLKTDPNQVGAGAFLSLQNSVFDKGGRLSKRNGFKLLTPLPVLEQYLTTFNGNLTAIGSQVLAYSQSTSQWAFQGEYIPLSLSVLPLLRNNVNQTQTDSVVASNIVCTVYTETDGTNISYKYVVADYVTGQNLLPPAVIPAADAGTVSGSPRVFVVGNYFVIMFSTTVSANSYLQYITVNYVTLTTYPPVDLSTDYTAAPTVAFDGATVNGVLYVAWCGSTTGINMAAISPTLIVVYRAIPDTAHKATMFSVCGDLSNNIWVSYYNLSTTNGYAFRVNNQLITLTAVTQIISTTTVLNLASVGFGHLFFYYEVSNHYSYDASIASNYIESNDLHTNAALGTAFTIVRGAGLASKAAIATINIGSVAYFLAAYQNVVGTPYQNNGNYQVGYYLIQAPTGGIASQLAYGNGGGYITHGLPQLQFLNSTLISSYLLKDSISAVNKGTALPSGTQVDGIYSQLGINLATFSLSISEITSVEIGNNLNLSGGFLWAYDGYSVTESGFFLWPDSVEGFTGTSGGNTYLGGWSATGGSIAAKPDGSTNADAYFYQVTYEWTDNQGNAFRSAPSIPISVTTTGSGTAGSIVLNIPTLRLTYKLANPVKIVIYRWSVAQEIYYQVTSITQPILNNPTIDSIAYTDTLADATILGNNILYTNGGVVEDVAPPASTALSLFDDRLWMIDSEDRNLLWYSKQVIESTPVEMSNLFTIYVAPSIGAQGSTGELQCIFPLDDKLIMFKSEAIYYLNGTGPDNTGANSTYSQPLFITATVGCTNQNSIVFCPEGLMFQSNKGIWLLGRDLSTSYIGAPVESLTQFNPQSGTTPLVLSALVEPGTNQVRFTMNTGITLVYDYYFKQWGSFIGIPGVSSTLYQSLHTYITNIGQVYQESVGSFFDGTTPVCMQFTTGWLQLQKLQGFQRAYYFYLLGTYISSHNLQISVAYDYGPASQIMVLTPGNNTPNWGGDPLWGSSTPWGGPGNAERWRVFLERGKCSAVQISIQEMYDPSGGPAGAGLTLSGINMVIGGKKGYPTLNPAHSVG